MQIPELPATEAQRLATLNSLKVLDTDAEERFDRITRVASKMFQVPTVLVSLIDSQRQWFKSRVGCDVTETPREISFAATPFSAMTPTSLLMPAKIPVLPTTLWSPVPSICASTPGSHSKPATVRKWELCA